MAALAPLVLAALAFTLRRRRPARAATARTGRVENAQSARGFRTRGE